MRPGEVKGRGGGDKGMEVGEGYMYVFWEGEGPNAFEELARATRKGKKKGKREKDVKTIQALGIYKKPAVLEFKTFEQKTFRWRCSFKFRQNMIISHCINVSKITPKPVQS